MIYSATIVYFNTEQQDELIAKLKTYTCVEIHHVDGKAGKLVITIEGEDTNDIEKVEQELLALTPAVIDVAHHAFDFSEEVELVAEGKKVPDVRDLIKLDIIKEDN